MYCLLYFIFSIYHPPIGLLILNEIDYQKEGISKLDKVIDNIEDLIIENIIQNKDKLIIDSLFSK